MLRASYFSPRRRPPSDHPSHAYSDKLPACFLMVSAQRLPRCLTRAAPWRHGAMPLMRPSFAFTRAMPRYAAYVFPYYGLFFVAYDTRALADMSRYATHATTRHTRHMPLSMMLTFRCLFTFVLILSPAEHTAPSLSPDAITPLFSILILRADASC